MPVAKSPAAPPAAKVMQQTAKVPAKEMPSKPLSVADPAKTTAPKSHGAGSTPKSLGKGAVPKKAAKAPQQQSVPSVKLEVGQCSRCFAQTFKGQIQCDVCGLMLEDASRAQRTKIAERRNEELPKLGVKYDFKGDFLKQITDKQLEGLGLLGDQARGSTSPEADLSSRAKSRHARALDLGYSSILAAILQGRHLCCESIQ